MNSTSALNAATKFFSTNYPSIIDAAKFISTNHSITARKISVALCIAPATELAIRGLCSLISQPFVKEEDKAKTRDYTSYNLAGAVAFGLCAARIFPGSTYVGAASFFIPPAVVGVFAQEIQGLYFTFQVPAFIGKYTIRPIRDWILQPIFTGMVNVAKKIRECIPDNPLWTVVSALVIAGICWRVYSNRASQGQSHNPFSTLSLAYILFRI